MTPPVGLAHLALVDASAIPFALGRPVIPRRGVALAFTSGGSWNDRPVPSELLLVARPPGTLFRDGRSGEMRVRAFVPLRVISLRDIDFSGADLTDLNLEEADLRGASMEGVALCGAYAGLADLSGANLSRACLRGADISGADLTGACVSGADLRGADASGADLTRADLSGADLTGADLAAATLQHADLTDATLVGSDLSHADLCWANLSEADLTGAELCADFRMAHLNGANFEQTEPWSSIWELAWCDPSTRWPDGFDPDAEEILHEQWS